MIHDETDEKGMYDFLATHALISDHAASTIQHKCDFAPNATKQSVECESAVDEANKSVHFIDIYNIYAPTCHSSNLTSKPIKPSVSII